MANETRDPSCTNDDDDEQAVTVLKATKDKLGLSLSVQKKEGDLKFLSKEYDDFYNYSESLDGVFLSLGVTGIALAPAVAPLAAIGIVAKGFQLVASKSVKSNELSYISSACLTFVTNITRDVREMTMFYDTQLANDKQIKIDPALVGVLQANLYKFLYFLIDNIDFTLQNLGAMQYVFWAGFLSKIDFNTYETDDQNRDYDGKYRYSHKKCIPDKLRLNLRKKKVVILSKGAEGFTKCFDETNCNSYNDILMRLLEYNVHILMKTFYNGNSDFKLLQAKVTGLSKDEVFKLDNSELSTKLDDVVVGTDLKLKGIALVVIQLNRLAKELWVNQTDLDAYLKNSTYTGYASSSISGLRQKLPSFTFRSNNKVATSSGEVNVNVDDDDENAALLQNGGASLFGIITLFGSPNQKYREMLREYTIMTGNFSMLISRYNLDYHKAMEIDANNLKSQLVEMNKKLNASGCTVEKLDTIGENIEKINEQLESDQNNGAGEANGLTVDTTTENQERLGGSKTKTRKQKRPKKTKKTKPSTTTKSRRRHIK